MMQKYFAFYLHSASGGRIFVLSNAMKRASKLNDMAKKFAVQTISDQVQGNYDAWAKTVSIHDSEHEAEQEATRLFNRDWDNIPKGGGHILGYSYRVKKIKV